MGAIHGFAEAVKGTASDGWDLGVDVVKTFNRIDFLDFVIILWFIGALLYHIRESFPIQIRFFHGHALTVDR